MHVAAIVDVFKCFAHVDEDVPNVLAEFISGTGHPFFEIGSFDVFHGHEGDALDLAVLDVVDDVVVFVDFCEDFASGDKAFLGCAVPAKGWEELSDGDGLPFRIRGQPKIGHPAGVDQLDQAVGTELPWFVFVRRIGAS